jgi:hypothetical protein
LKLVIAEGICPDTMHDFEAIQDEEEWDMISFVHFLCRCEHVEVFSLCVQRERGFGVSERTPVFFHCLAVLEFETMPIPLSKIRELELVGHDIEKHDLLGFVDKRKNTLEKLSMKRIRPWRDPEGRWPDIERDIRSASGKEGLKLELSRCYDWDPMDDLEVF